MPLANGVFAPNPFHRTHRTHRTYPHRTENFGNFERKGRAQRAPLSPLNWVPAIEVIAYHGWGFDRHCWQSWQQKFRDLGVAFMAFDRGYFGHPHQPEFSPESPYKILLTHSYGLHLCPTHQQQQAHLWVIFAGFQSFHPPEPKAKRYSQRVLQRMLQQLERDPRSVLHQFYCNTYAPIPYGPISWQSHASAIPDWLLAWPIEPWQIEPLRQDLKHLNQVDRGLTGDALPERILIFHGTADQIVDKGQGQRLVQQVQQMQLSNNPVTFSKISGAGHGLPFTHLADCWAIVHAFLPPAQRC